MSHQPSRKPP